jgi:DNA-binding beta-propeller fold protein YncE
MRRKLALLLALAGCSSGPDFKSNCTAGTPSDEALVQAGKQADGSVVLPDGRRITPAGKVLKIGGFPISMRVLPGDRYVVVSDAAYGDEYLRIIDSQAADSSTAVVSSVGYPFTRADAHSPAIFYGLALTADGKTLYVSDGAYDPVPDSVTDKTQHYNIIEIFSITGTPPALTRSGEIHLPFSGTASAGTNRLPAGLALAADEQTMYVAAQGDGTLAVVDLTAGATFGQELGRTPAFGVDPYDVAVTSTSTVLVSLWGGTLQGGHGFVDGVQPIDVSMRNAPMPKGAVIPTGKATEALLTIAGKTWVTATDADQIVPIDDTNLTAGPAISTAFDGTGLVGSAPNSLALDAARDRLYVANAGENAVQAFRASSMQPLGRIPTGWYPTAVSVLGDGTLLIASAKGLGAGPTDHPPGKNEYMQGTLQIVPPPSDADLMTGDATVHDNLTRPRNYEVQLTCTADPKAFSLPAAPGAPSPIKYSFLIVRENKTYDAVLGDLPGTNGDPNLAIFGGDITPNLHALAQRFVNLDNFYSLAEQSLQGHEWTTANMANDYAEKGWLTTWGRYTRPYAAFAGDMTGHIGLPQSPTIWKALDAAGVAYHNYGEIVNTSGALHVYDVDYPGVFFNTDITDVDKISYVTDNVRDPTFSLEPFSYILLPNDHTVGTTPGKPTPDSMVADNDEATGRFIDALSHSDYWKSSAVFVIEDDPSDGGDHVEIHRSPCLVISPWVKSGYTSSVHYDVPALWHTLTLLIGIPPINQRDANAPAMYDVFSPTADLRPYTFVPRKIPEKTNSSDAPLADESARIDFSRPDSAPLGRILWKAMKGRDAEPPWGTRPVVDGDDD